MSHNELFAGMLGVLRDNSSMPAFRQRQNSGYQLRHFIVHFKMQLKVVPVLVLFMLILTLSAYASPPTELLSIQEGTQVTVAWKAPTDIQIIGYAVYRGTNQNTLTRIAIVGTNIPADATGTPPPTLFTDTSVTVGNSYFYKVKAIDIAGAESAFSAVTATTNYQLVSTYHSDGIPSQAVVGDFNGDGIPDLALGSPGYQVKGKMYGQVAIYFGGTGRKKIITTLIGEQDRSYFGKSLAVADLNKDGFDDLIVGAPVQQSHLTLVMAKCIFLPEGPPSAQPLLR